MIGDGHGRHLVFRRSLGKRVVIAGAVQQAEAGVKVEMNKV